MSGTSYRPNGPRSGSFDMNNDYNPRNVRHTVAAIICTIVCSSAFVLSAVAPAQAVTAPTHQIAARA